MKIAIAQINPVVGDIPGNREIILKYIKDASSSGADIVVFPEMSTIGYPPMDLLENSKLLRDNLDSLESVVEESRKHEMAICLGYVDRDPENPPMLFNSAAFIYGGEILLKQHKTLLPGYDVFDEYRYFSPAREHEVLEFRGKTLGLTICEDIWNALHEDSSPFMEQRRYSLDPIEILSEKGAELVINLSASPFVKGKIEARTWMLQETARKHSVAIVYANQVGGNDSLVFDGTGMAIDKKGNVLDAAPSFTEDLRIIDMEGEVKGFREEDELEYIHLALKTGLRDYCFKSGFRSAVLGLSGGIDSALTAALACEALGSENVLGITMPSPYSSSGSIDDSVVLAENLGMKIEKINISGLFDLFKKELHPLFSGMEEDVTEENIQARIRGTLLMAVSNKTGALLLTTGNKSESATGYCTLYGDMNGGLAVISDLPKTLVYRLSVHINRKHGSDIIPVEIIEKAPSAELRPDQKDQDSLPPYDILDGILELYIEQRQSVDEIVKQGYDRETVKRILRLVNLNEYKRFQAAPGIKVTSKAFGTGRRIPLVKRFEP